MRTMNVPRSFPKFAIPIRISRAVVRLSKALRRRFFRSKSRGSKSGRFKIHRKRDSGCHRRHRRRKKSFKMPGPLTEHNRKRKRCNKKRMRKRGRFKEHKSARGRTGDGTRFTARTTGNSDYTCEEGTARKCTAGRGTKYKKGRHEATILSEKAKPVSGTSVKSKASNG